MDQNENDVSIVLRTSPNRDETDLLAYLQSLLERRDAALAQPLVQDASPVAGPDAGQLGRPPLYRH